MSKATITSKGQITIPLSVRKALNLHDRDRLEFHVEGDAILIKPIRNSLLSLYGVVPSKKIGATKQQIRTAVQRSVAQRRAKKGRA